VEFERVQPRCWAGAPRIVTRPDSEAEAIADQAQVAVAAAAAAGGAAVGLGTLVTMAASTVAADVTEILLASVVLGIGFLIIPARRRRAKATLGEKVAALRAMFQRSGPSSIARASGAAASLAMRPVREIRDLGRAALDRRAAVGQPPARRHCRVTGPAPKLIREFRSQLLQLRSRHDHRKDVTVAATLVVAHAQHQRPRGPHHH
jgi:hypothetical protein